MPPSQSKGIASSSISSSSPSSSPLSAASLLQGMIRIDSWFLGMYAASGRGVPADRSNLDPTPPRPTMATRVTSAAHFSQIQAEMLERSTKSGSLPNGTVKKGSRFRFSRSMESANSRAVDLSLKDCSISFYSQINAFFRPSPYISGIWILKMPSREYAASSSRFVSRLSTHNIRSLILN